MDPKLYSAASGIVSKSSSQISWENLNFNENLPVTCGKGNNILHVAAQSGNQHSVEHILINSHSSFAYEPNTNDDTPLHIAARLGHLEVARLLVDHVQLHGGLEAATNLLEIVNVKKNTVLHEAVQNGHREIVELLIEKDKHLTSVTNIAGESPLFLALDREYYEIARCILKTLPNCSFLGRNGMTVMHAATIRNQSFFVRELLDNCESEILEVADDHGWMPLHYAAQVGNVFAVQLFLEINGSLAYIKDSEGMTALHISAMNGEKDVLRKLVEERPDICELVDNKGQTALHVAVESGERDVLKMLLNTSAFVDFINEQDEEGNTSLHLAAINLDYPILEILGIDKRVDKGIINDSKMTALDIIMENKQLNRDEKARIRMMLIGGGVPPSLDRAGLNESKTRPTSESSTESVDEDKVTTQEVTVVTGILDASENSLLIATIIASVTFAAVMQVPGGYTTDGTPNLKGKPSFKYFMLFNSLAFGLATGSLFIHFLDTTFLSLFIPGCFLNEGVRPRLLAGVCLRNFNTFSILSTMFAYIFAANAVLSNKEVKFSPGFLFSTKSHLFGLDENVTVWSFYSLLIVFGLCHLPAVASYLRCKWRFWMRLQRNRKGLDHFG